MMAKEVLESLSAYLAVFKECDVLCPRLCNLIIIGTSLARVDFDDRPPHGASSEAVDSCNSDKARLAAMAFFAI